MPARRVLLEEFHLSILIPKEVSNFEARAMNRVLTSRRFQLRLRRSLEELLHLYPALTRTTVRVSR